MFIDDVSNALDVVIHNGTPGNAYNIGTSVEIPIRQVAADISALFGSDPETSILFTEDRHFNDRSYLMDSSKMQGLGWQPAISWEHGLALTVDWYRRNTRYWPHIEDALIDHPAVRRDCDAYIIGLVPEQITSIQLCVIGISLVNFAVFPESPERLLIEVSCERLIIGCLPLPAWYQST